MKMTQDLKQESGIIVNDHNNDGDDGQGDDV